MEMLAGILLGALMGSGAAAMMRVDSWRGISTHALLGVAGAVLGGLALSLLLPGSWAEIDDGVLVWSVAGACAMLCLATVANVLQLALDLETS